MQGVVGPTGMTTETIYALGASQVSISGGESLSNTGQGDGSQLVGKTITLGSQDWSSIRIKDDDDYFGDNDGNQKLDGQQAFDGQTFQDSARVEAEYEFQVQGPDGTTYTMIGFNINEGGGGASYSTIEGLAFVGDPSGFPPPGTPLTVISASDYPGYLYSDMAAPPCFTTGCQIVTPRGAVDVADLAVGDRLCTMDNGFQTIRWIGRCRLPTAALADHPDFRPILIRRDAFGPGCPDRDIRLSPQHRVLARGSQSELLFGESEVLVPIKKLINGTSILRDESLTDVTYHHILLDRHEVIWSDGLASESLLGDIESDHPSAAEARALLSFDAGRSTPSARLCVSDKRVALLHHAA
ncbi:MAG: hypothetical protein CML02_15075 [Pseudooceanicola sp.]|nr:hypothetical protein [Pseudooceanicola sp.]